MKVKDCMCHEVAYVNPDCSVEECAKLMCNNHVGCIPVCNTNKEVVGLVTDRDILLRSVACDKDTCNTTASQIMSTDVCTCKQDDEMTNAESKMSSKQIRRLPVCDENNHVIGILTVGDLAHNGNQLGSQEVCTTIENICGCNSSKQNNS